MVNLPLNHGVLDAVVVELLELVGHRFGCPPGGRVLLARPSRLGELQHYSPPGLILLGKAQGLGAVGQGPGQGHAGGLGGRVDQLLWLEQRQSELVSEDVVPDGVLEAHVVAGHLTTPGNVVVDAPGEEPPGDPDPHRIFIKGPAHAQDPGRSVFCILPVAGLADVHLTERLEVDVQPSHVS